MKQKKYKNVIARSVSDVAILKDKIASPSVRNDKEDIFG